MTSREKSVLIVDHDPISVRATAVILERFGAGYKCEVATTRAQATEHLSKRTYDIILLDTDIQERFDGLKLVQLILMQTGSRSKASAPVILLAATKLDREVVQRAVTTGITDFIIKPYPPQTLLQRIEKVMQARGDIAERAFSEHLTQTLKQVSHIPTLSAVFAKVQELLSSPEPSVEEVSHVIEGDPAITMRILRLANSAYFGFTQPVQTVKHAISLLGFQTIQNVVLAVSTFEALGKETSSAGLDKMGLWQHMIGCGEIAAFLAIKQNLPKNNEGFVGGLLHDVGKIVVDTFFSEYYVPVLEAVRSREIALIDAEREILGLTHADVGMQLASMWNLPPNLASIIGYHHQPMTAPEGARVITALVHLSNTLCWRFGIGNAGDQVMPAVNEKILEFLKIDPALLQDWSREVREQAEKSMLMLPVLGGD